MFKPLSETTNLNFPVHVTQSSYPTKPNTKQWVLAHSELASPFVELSPVQLKKALIDEKKIARFGCTVPDETTKEKKWIAQKLFVLDFDTKGNDNFWRLSELKDRLASFQIDPMMIYTTFSHTKDAPRYRIVFNLECTIVDKGLAQFLQNALYQLFCLPSKAEPDSHSKVLVQNWIGGNECVLFDPNATVSPVQIMDALQVLFELGCTNGTRQFDRFFSSCTQGRLMGFESIDIEINDMHCVDIGEIIGENQYKRMDTMLFGSILAKTGIPYNILGDHPFCQNSDKKIYSPDLISRYDIHSPTDTKTHPSNIVCKATPKVELNGSKMEQLTERCELMYTFNEGITELPHASLMHLAYNLYSMKSGSVWYKTMLQNYIFNNPKEKMKVSILHSSTLKKAKPSQCQNDRCPFFDACEKRGKNILSQLDTDAVQEIAPPAPSVAVEVVREALRKDIESALAEESTKVHVFKAPCGIGKSEIFLSQPLDRCFVAAPTHKLSHELFNRWIDKGKKGYLWEGRPALPSRYESEANAIEHLRLTGQLKELFQTILNDVDIPDDVKIGIQSYLLSLDEIWKESIVFGTHAKALTMNSSTIDTYIFDEDITNMLQVTEISQKDITRILSIIANQDEFKDIFSFLAQVEQVPSIQPVKIEHQIDAKQWGSLIQKNSKVLESPIVSIIDGKAFMRHWNSILVATANPLNTSKKYIILSATANETLYRLALGDRLVWHEYPDVVKKGKVILHPKKAYSKSYIQRKGLDAITFDMKQDMDLFGFDGIITYKYLTESRNGNQYIIGTDIPVFATFGALAGLDAMKGKNIAIYGMPRQTPQYIALLIFLLTGEFQGDWIKVSKKKITTKQHRFSYYGSNDERYLEMDMGFIVGELEQAIGRSRIIDNPCTVHLFSGMPIQGVEGFDD